MTEFNPNAYVKIIDVLDAIQNSTHPAFSKFVNDSWEAHVLGVVASVKPEDVIPAEKCKTCEMRNKE